MNYLIASIPWTGSKAQMLTLLGMGIFVGYSSFILVAKKDSLDSPRKSLWASSNRSEWK